MTWYFERSYRMGFKLIHYIAGDLTCYIDVIDERLFDQSTMQEVPWIIPGPPVPGLPVPTQPLSLVTFTQEPYVGLQAIMATSDLKEGMAGRPLYGVVPRNKNIPIVGLQAITFRQGPHVGLQAIIAGSDLDEETMEVLPWSPRTRIVNILFGGQTAPEEAHE
jgi:hypothetical protein